MASEETLKGKKEVFDGRKGTTHWPVRPSSHSSGLMADMSRTGILSRPNDLDIIMPYQGDLMESWTLIIGPGH